MLDDYMDRDVAYLIGLIIGRGNLVHDQRQITLEFPHSALNVQGRTFSADQRVSIRLGLIDIRERLLELLESDILMVSNRHNEQLVIRFRRENMMWRNIKLITNNKSTYSEFRVPPIFFEPSLPVEIKLQFLKGYADVAGNIRPSNNYMGKLNRVRLDVLNYKANWQVPVELCALLQTQCGIPVHLITWGHPNLGRGFKEHQINIFAEHFRTIGFSFDHKQKMLEELAFQDAAHPEHHRQYRPCPGPGGRIVQPHRVKPVDPQETNAAHLPIPLVGQHYDAYWQICYACGCHQAPTTNGQNVLADSMLIIPGSGTPIRALLPTPDMITPGAVPMVGAIPALVDEDNDDDRSVVGD